MIHFGVEMVSDGRHENAETIGLAQNPILGQTCAEGAAGLTPPSRRGQCRLTLGLSEPRIQMLGLTFQVAARRMVA